MSGTRASNDRPPAAGGVKRGRLQHEAATTGSRVTVVLGAQWGDEGKGKVVDLLATDADIISRFQVRAGRRVPPPPAQRAPLPSPRTQTDPVLPALQPSWDTPLGRLPSRDTLPSRHPRPLTRTHHPLTAPCHSWEHTLPSPTASPRDPAFPTSPTPQGSGPGAEL